MAKLCLQQLLKVQFAMLKPRTKGDKLLKILLCINLNLLVISIIIESMINGFNF